MSIFKINYSKIVSQFEFRDVTHAPEIFFFQSCSLHLEVHAIVPLKLESEIKCALSFESEKVCSLRYSRSYICT